MRAAEESGGGEEGKDRDGICDSRDQLESVVGRRGTYRTETSMSPHIKVTTELDFQSPALRFHHRDITRMRIVEVD